MTGSRQLKLEAVRRNDRTFAAVVPAEHCRALAWIIDQLDQRWWSQNREHLPPSILRLRNELDRISRISDAVAASASGNPHQETEGDSAGWCSTTEAAERLGLTSSRIRQLARDGELDGARKNGRDWLIPLESIDWWLAASLSPEAGNPVSTAAGTRPRGRRKDDR